MCLFRYVSILVLWVSVSLLVKSQEYVTMDYPDIPNAYDAIFVDHVSGYASGVVKSAYGQYFGQVTPEGEVYGYGTFYTEQDGEVYGQFRNGSLVFGIKLGTKLAKVGTEDCFVTYDLFSGNGVYLIRGNEKSMFTKDNPSRRRFLSITYSNGDRYVGETVDGKRSGYGIYYYSNGNYYYGKYLNDERKGHGAMFRTDSSIALQCW